jgi:D-3-phosphoglycerate dehydrogenase
MGHTASLGILVVGDSYCPSAAMREAFNRISHLHRVSFVDVTDDADWVPSTASERRLREYMGTPAQVIGALADHEVLVVQGAPVTDAVLAADPKLRLVGCARGGPVNIDVPAASERGIPVVTAPGKNADAAADLTIAFLVMLARRLPEVFRHVGEGGEFGHDNYEGAKWFGHDLAGHTLGIVGLGQIGRRVADRARAFGMRVLAYDPFVEPEVVRASDAEPVELLPLLRAADFVSLHARATSANRGLIGAREIRAMKPGAYLVNTARDTLLDEPAVLAGLASGHLAGVAVDVLSPSPPTGRHPFLEHPNVVVTAHIGGATFETLRHGGEMIVEEIERFAAGEPMRNVANPNALSVAAGGSSTR